MQVKTGGVYKYIGVADDQAGAEKPGQAGGRPPDGAPTVSPLERAMRTLQNIFPRPGATTAESPTALTGSHLPFAMVLLQRAIPHWPTLVLGPKVLTQKKRVMQV